MGSGPHRFVHLFLLMIPTWLSSSFSDAYKFYVGGKDGWVVKPSEEYNHWAQRNRFQINDTLYFKYKKGSDSVLVVKKENYDSCNTKSPIQKMDGGDSSFTFDRSGPFFFISGNAGNCQKGQKLIVVVLAVRHHKPQSPPPVAAPGLSPASGSPPAVSPGSWSPEPSEGPSSTGDVAPAPSPGKDGSGSMRFGVGERSCPSYNTQHVVDKVKDDDGKLRWKRVKVKPEEHVKVPIFPETESGIYDQYFDDYVSRILTERTPNSKPLWEVHVIKYPTTNAAGTVIMKLHHALGDGYSLMGALLSCLHRADDPSLPLSFPSRPENSTKKSILKRLPSAISSFFDSIPDFGWSLIKSGMMEDDISPIRSGFEGTESQPFALSNILFSLDRFKEIKSKLGVTTNDVITGMISYGIRLYMQEIDYETRMANSTAVVMLNTRKIEGYQSVKDMLKPDSKGQWGNRISFLQVSIPKLSQDSISNPLEFVWKAHKIIKRKRHSFSVFLIGWLLDLEMKLRGHEAVAKHIYTTLGNCSVVISNLNGPIERMALANHPVKGFYFTMTGGPENVNITIMSYMKTLRVTLRTLKGFIDEHKFKCCIQNAFEVIYKAAMEETQKNPELN
ncbi:O-acyltransferase WSD1 [Senna tora]|uniref:O-acyltransferase WSD1 n=1 Tax=Senna tora TaxID=362788 RepID=A0A834SMD2_9FABA|nr:O-acyltransferase WSD1 [Senna tora]